MLHSLLPRAFSRFNQTFMWIDTVNDLIMVDAASAKRAEDTLALLRKSLGSLPVVPLTMESPIELTLTEWVRSGEMPAGFAIQDEAELKAILEEGGVIRCKKQNLISDEIAVHIEAGKLVTKLAVDWQERIQLMLSDDGSLKRLKFADTLREQNDDIDRDDFAQRFDADFILMTSELAALIKNTIEALGGEPEAPVAARERQQKRRKALLRSGGGNTKSEAAVAVAESRWRHRSQRCPEPAAGRRSRDGRRASAEPPIRLGAAPRPSQGGHDEYQAASADRGRITVFRSSLFLSGPGC